MTGLGPLVLPSDVAVVPVAQLPPDLRNQIEHQPGDYCVTRPRSRTTTSVVDESTASLLEQFREPTTIVDAVIAFSVAAGLEPGHALEDAFPVLTDFVREGLLLPAGSALARPVEASLASGDVVGGATIVEPVHLFLDTEVYLTRLADGSPAALKILRDGAQADIARLLRHEATVLRALDGRYNPLVLGSGDLAGRPFLILSWIAGVDVHDAAAEARRVGGPEGTAALLELAEQVVAAFAHLHRQGVLHGDVHPRNVFAGPDQRVVLLDFGFAVRAGEGGTGAPGQRGGVDLFLEPELADAYRTGQAGRQPTAVGEQYSVAALVYFIVAGAHTHAFSLHPEHMLRQLRDEPPLPLSAHHGPSLPATERVLRRALSKDPARRYLSLAHLLRSLRAAAASDRTATSNPAPARTPEPGQELLARVLARLAVPGRLFDGGLAPPTASVMNGAAGFAYALLRIAQRRGDTQTLALADLWSVRATDASTREEAFVNKQLNMVPEILGENSFYHNVSGVHCVEALIAQARGDGWSRDVALDAFLQAAGASCPELDVAFGRSGLLLGCATLLEECSGSSRDVPLRTLGTALRDSVLAELADAPPIADGHRLRALGAAHGWAGYLFALLRWAQASASKLPDGLVDRLDQLGGLAQPAGRGLLWPFEARGERPHTLMSASWCNGAAGQVHLWWLAHTLTGEPRYEHWAQGAAWSAYEAPLDAPSDLCCGYAGRAYALLAHYAKIGEPIWLARARTLANLAATSVGTSQRPDSLYKGEVGTALLACEVEAPVASMPLYDGEGRPGQGAPGVRASLR
jgi:serine/threonine-protein kinase